MISKTPSKQTCLTCTCDLLSQSRIMYYKFGCVVAMGNVPNDTVDILLCTIINGKKSFKLGSPREHIRSSLLGSNIHSTWRDFVVLYNLTSSTKK